eukprot:scaffold130258_cov69-Phaeocystis_antarctica.AAC.1
MVWDGPGVVLGSGRAAESAEHAVPRRPCRSTPWARARPCTASSTRRCVPTMSFMCAALLFTYCTSRSHHLHRVLDAGGAAVARLRRHDGSLPHGAGRPGGAAELRRDRAVAPAGRAGRCAGRHARGAHLGRRGHALQVGRHRARGPDGGGRHAAPLR